MYVIRDEEVSNHEHDIVTEPRKERVIKENDYEFGQRSYQIKRADVEP